MISVGWAWIGPTDVLNAEEAMIPGNQRVQDAQRALSGWLYFQDNLQLETGFVEKVKLQTLADFGVANELDILHPTSSNLYDVCAWACIHA